MNKVEEHYSLALVELELVYVNCRKQALKHECDSAVNICVLLETAESIKDEQRSIRKSLAIRLVALFCALIVSNHVSECGK